MTTRTATTTTAAATTITLTTATTTTATTTTTSTTAKSNRYIGGVVKEICTRKYCLTDEQIREIGDKRTINFSSAKPYTPVVNIIKLRILVLRIFYPYFRKTDVYISVK